MCRAAAQTRPVGKQSPRAAPRTAPRSRLCGGRSCVSGSQDWAAEDFKVMPRPASKLAAEHGVEPGSPDSQSGATASLLASRKGVRALHEGSGSRRGRGAGGGGLAHVASTFAIKSLGFAASLGRVSIRTLPSPSESLGSHGTCPSLSVNHIDAPPSCRASSAMLDGVRAPHVSCAPVSMKSERFLHSLSVGGFQIRPNGF